MSAAPHLVIASLMLFIGRGNPENINPGLLRKKCSQ